MTSSASRAISANKASEVEKIVNFSPERLRAPFALRCAALSVDYMILLILPVGWLSASKILGETGSPAISPIIWIVGALLFLGNFLLMPLLRGQTLGKMVTGLTILNIDGTATGVGGILKRNLLGYLLTILTLGVGFLISAFNSSGRALHDFSAGTIVVRGRKTQV